MSKYFSNAYGVFVLHEQLKINGLLKKQYDQGLDVVWEYCVAKYMQFIDSSFNSELMSEYDCITKYVKNLVESTIEAERRESHEKLVRRVRDEANVNIVTCGNCAVVILHDCDDQEIKCWQCGYKSEPCDFPDLFIC